jgi:hypothetical protein
MSLEALTAALREPHAPLGQAEIAALSARADLASSADRLALLGTSLDRGHR